MNCITLVNVGWIQGWCQSSVMTSQWVVPSYLLGSLATMLASLWMLSFFLPTLWTQVLIRCPFNRLCQQALLSGNDVVLQCDHPKARWFFTSVLTEELILLSDMSNVKELPGGCLQLTNPQPTQTGLYHCQDNNGTLLVEYKIDFQDVNTLHVTHRGLRQEPLSNESLQLDVRVTVFTHWEPWQDCNRCDEPGERKRLGYCYMEEPLGKPKPCGLSLGPKKVKFSMRPELQVEACLVPCKHPKEIKQPYFIFDTYQLGTLTNSMWLTCPLASIYSCAPGQPCQKALLSNNDVLLRCNLSGAQWYYFHLQDGSGWSSDLTRVPNIGLTPKGLLIKSPLPSQTGFYQCGNTTTNSVLYGIDFQNAEALYVTHRGLGQEPLQNESLSLGSEEFIFTQWEPWQGCNHCKKPGERKRLGYCYIQDPLEKKPLPCWLFVRHWQVLSSRLRPEMQVEAGHVPCTKLDMGFIFFNDFKLTDESGSVWLTCPLGSVYRPVIWEANNVPLTWQGQLSGQDVSTVLDLSSGGQRLQIFQPAVYKCFVQQELVALFNPKPDLKILIVQKGEAEAHEKVSKGKANSVLKGLMLMLLVGMSLGLFVVLFKFFHPSRNRRSEQVLLIQ